MQGIVSYGAYLPYHRIERAAIAGALGTPAAGGARCVASYDEDTTTMGVEAGRAALRTAPAGVEPTALLFATADPVYLDKTNATAIHAALGLRESAAAYDVGGAARSGAGALRLALTGAAPALVVTSDVRTGLPGGTDESTGGDAAVAFLVGDADHAVAELLASASSTAEFTDRWRHPGAVHSQQWEERFGETVYVPLGLAAAADALKQAGVAASDVDHVMVVGLHARAVRQVAKSLGTPAEALAPDLTAQVGNAGTAQLGLALAATLDRAEPGRTILALALGDGADALVLRTTGTIARYRPAATVASLVDAGHGMVPYATFLTWRGQLHREPPRRPEPERFAAPAAHRSEAWKYGFVGSRCECGTRHLPPQRTCLACGAVDRMVPERLADTPATIATFTVDRLAFSLSPPVVVAVLDFDGGGRFQCEMTDVDPDAVAIGDPVGLTFRRLSTAGGLHNYFWKARPIRATAQEG